MTRFVVSYFIPDCYSTRLFDVPGVRLPTDRKVQRAARDTAGKRATIDSVVVNDGKIPIGDWVSKEAFEGHKPTPWGR